MDEYDSCYACFCPHAERNNSFVICEICKAEIHERCYGLPDIEDDSDFYCDICLDRKADSKGRVSPDRESILKAISRERRVGREEAADIFYKQAECIICAR